MKNVKIIVGSIPKNSLQKKIALSIKEKFSGKEIGKAGRK